MKSKGPLSTSSYVDPLQRILVPAIFVIASIVLGTTGYLIIEKMSFLNALYLTVATMFLAMSYIDSIHLSSAGKIFSMVFLVLGVVSVFYAVGTIIEFIVEGNIVGIRRKKKMDKKLEEMNDHLVICGFGRVGHQIAKDFERDKTPFVVIDAKPQTAEELEERGVPFVIGDVSSDEVLEKAGIKRAKGLLATADSDTENVYVTLAARVMNPSLNIIARAGSKGTESKLRRAGANSVMAPYYVAGNRMASMALTPVSIEFLDIVTGSDNIEFWMKEFKVEKKSHLADKTLGEANIRQSSGVMILSIKKTTGKFDLSPKADSRMEVGDILIALGTTEQLTSLEKMM